jgi:hypothetical protein
MAWTKTKTAVVACACALLAVGTATVAWNEIQAHRNYPGLTGVWEGTSFNQRVALKIARTNGTYLATFDYVDVGVDIPASHFKAGKSAISFRIAGAPAGFAASIDPGMTQMSGNWHEGTNSYPVTLKRMANPDFNEPLTESDYTPRSGSDLQGLWKGIILAGARRLSVTLKIAEPEAGKLRAEMDRVDWGGEHIPAGSITRDGDTIKIGFLLLGSFEGALDTAAGQLAGRWTQGSNAYSVTFNRVDAQAEQSSRTYIPASPFELQGHWKGTLELPTGKLHFVFHIAKLPDGSVCATLDNPDQGAHNVQATTTQYTPPNVSILWFGIGGVFNGALQNGKLTGTWRQGGKVHPLTLSRD